MRGGHDYIVVAVDVFSRFMYAEPLKQLSAKTARDAFLKMSGSKNIKIADTDHGPEFQKEFEQMLQQNNISHRIKGKGGINNLAVVDRKYKR